MSAEKIKQYKSIALKLCAGGLTLAVAGLVYFYSAPKYYRATAKAKIVKSGWNATNDSKFSFGPERLVEECKLAGSDEALDRVVSNLDLSAVWGGNVSQGSRLKTGEARDRLKAMLDIQPAPGAMMIEVRATGANPVELAGIVNEVAKVYADYRQSGREQASRVGVGNLRAQWEAKSQKAQIAEGELKKMELQFKRDRQMYDPNMVESLEARQKQLADEYKTKVDELAKLKSMDKPELWKTIAGLETNDNSVLIGALRQLAKANDDLRDTKSSRGPDAPETKSAQLAVQQLDQQVEGLINANLTLRSVDLSSLKVLLKATGDQLEQIKQSEASATNNAAKFAEQDAVYAKAYGEYQALVKERNVLQAEMMGSGSMSAVMPDTIAARVVDLADPPTKPASPDERIVKGALVGGGMLGAGGLALLVLLSIKPRWAGERGE